MKKQPEEIRTVTDECGNALLCINNGKRIKLILKLISEQTPTKKKSRRLGVINKAVKTFYIRRKRERHLFLKTNAYGFNHKILSEALLFDKIRLIDDVAEYLIPKKFILEQGKFLFFKSEGFEKQIFITLEQMEQFRKQPKF